MQIKDPYESAFNKLYFVNLFLSKGSKKTGFTDAKKAYPIMGAIAEKLTETELKVLIRNIENLL